MNFFFSFYEYFFNLSSRGDTSSGVNDRVLAQLLTEIDGGGGVYQVIIIIIVFLLLFIICKTIIYLEYE